ncbi:uncharacterized protein N0V89_012501 [Didymosphaeria variabile]|uniref:Uncharacterized protein n=1 Tax=Didymosphaeria variabile TaxID=1932322 RepID=A0A9W9C542_9PLEO|nr:uncharacterized protein N0V89_012501 [Didymosphaeria variabile]KAJ4344757.1 hypothetical protein N0V89_012501 [Didymosphaeria variabile]
MKLTLLLLALVALLVSAVPQADRAHRNIVPSSSCNNSPRDCDPKISSQGNADHDSFTTGDTDTQAEKDPYRTAKVLGGLYAMAIFVLLLL